MSAFVVQDKTINNIVSYLYLSRYLDMTIRKAKELGYNVKSAIGQNLLAQSLYDLNIEAVRQRYPNSETSRKTEGDYVYAFNPYVSTIQALKSAECLHYQMSEGEVPKTELYKWLTDCINSIKSLIINELEEYKNASWD